MHVKKRSQNVVTKTVFTLNVDYDWLGPVVRKPINLIQDSFLSYFQLFGESFFCLFLLFKIDFFWCKVLPNISVEQHLGVENSLVNF